MLSIIFKILWFLIPLFGFVVFPITHNKEFHIKFLVLILCNFLSYFWLFNDMVKTSFGTKYIKGFQYYSYDDEFGRYDTTQTIYEYYLPDVFWTNVYEWFGTGFFVYSIFILFIYTNISDYLYPSNKIQDNEDT